MSRRKQQAIATAHAEQELANKRNRQHLLSSRKMLVSSGITTLLVLAVVTQSSASNGAAFGGSFFSSAPSAAAPPPPQLSKEYVYAGGRMLAQEDAGSPASQSQPADLVVWRPSSGAWYARGSGDGTTSTGLFGAAGDKAVPADFDGDGLFDFCVFRPASGTWYILPSGGSGFYGLQFGLSDDVPAPADYDGDGREAKTLQIGDEIRKANGNWARVESTNQQSESSPVYNFEVEDNHNYFVGKTNLLVHNSDCFPDKKELAKRLKTTVKDFHDNIKPAIKKRFGKEMDQINSTSPDVRISDAGTVVLKNPITKRTIETGVPLDAFIP